MRKITDPITANAEDVAVMLDAAEKLQAITRQRTLQLAECHALLLRFSEDKFFDTRPVTGVARLAARNLLQRHGIIAAEEDQ